MATPTHGLRGPKLLSPLLNPKQNHSQSNCRGGPGEHIDASSVELFGRLLAEGWSGEAGRGRSSLFLVLAVRDTELDVSKEQPWASWLQLPHVTQLTVGSLGDEAAAQLVRTTAEDGEVSNHGQESTRSD